MVSKTTILDCLPPYEGKATVIKKTQSVSDIAKEIINANEFFKDDYKNICDFFKAESNETTLRNIFDFLKSNVEYREELTDFQTTKSPAALLIDGFGDCKHYAGFIAGILSALNQKGRNYDWYFTFAGYSKDSDEIGHVFISVKDNGRLIWIDPVLTRFDLKKPEPTSLINITTKKPDKMLQRISGMEGIGVYVPPNDYTVRPGNTGRDAVPGYEKKGSGFLDVLGQILAPVLGTVLGRGQSSGQCPPCPPASQQVSPMLPLIGGLAIGLLITKKGKGK